MPALPRKEMEEFWATWLEINREAESANDWGRLADCYAANATYGWMYSPDQHFMATNREEIRRWALGTEMSGLDGWHYDYDATVMDETNAMIVGFWVQRSGINDDATGKEYEVAGIGGSWFGLDRVDGETCIVWQRDWFDLGAAAATFAAIADAGKAPDGLLERMSQDLATMPGHYDAATLPSTVWPPAVDAGKHVTQQDH